MPYLFNIVKAYIETVQCFIRKIITSKRGKLKTMLPWKKLWDLGGYLTRGILPDWCHQHDDHKRRVVTIIRHFSFAIVFLFVFSVMIFQLIWTVIAILTMTSIHSVIPYLLWLSSIPLAVVTQIRYSFRRCDFLSYFNDWDRFEKHLAVQ